VFDASSATKYWGIIGELLLAGTDREEGGLPEMDLQHRIYIITNSDQIWEKRPTLSIAYLVILIGIVLWFSSGNAGTTSTP